jgi:hypothetical protein
MKSASGKSKTSNDIVMSKGPDGGKFMTQTTFIQRLNTNGGTAPPDTDGCGTLDKVGAQRLVPYTADYYFFHADD